MPRHFSPYPRFALLLWFALSLLSLPAIAATFTVTNLNDSGPGSLRQAMLEADAAVGDDTIVFQNGLSGTIILTTGQLTINSNIAIYGPGANVLAVSGNNVSPVFFVGICIGPTASIDGLTIKDGNNINSGGGIFNGGGTLTISNSILSGNSTRSEGGGIASVTTGCGSGNLFGKLTVINSTLSGNSAFRLPGNAYGSPAGAISVGYMSTATISNSTLSNNSADSGGGGILNFGTLAVSNSTISGNWSTSQYGGGIFNSQGGTLTLSNSIVAGNIAPTGKEVFNVTWPGPGVGGGIFISQGHNLFGEDGLSGVEGATLAANDIVPTVGIDAILAPLGDNGGPTQTHLLVLGSPAINAGDNALIPVGVTTDQRGFPRIQGGTVDIGAVEAGETSTTDIPTMSQGALLLLGVLLAGGAWLTHTGRTRPLQR